MFGVAPGRPSRFSLSRIEPILDAAHSRLEGVVLECLDWQEVIRRYDSPGTLFYLDPPYFGGETDYGKGLFDRDDFARMAEALAQLKGAFILSINDTPEMRSCFGAFDLEEVSITYTVAKESGMEARELIISNREVRLSLL